MNKTTLNSQKEKHSMLSLRRATSSPFSIKPVTIFLSTLSLRRATHIPAPRRTLHVYFYPRSPYGERPVPRMPSAGHMNFYPRSPYGERRCISRSAPVQAAFLSTLSLRRATMEVAICAACRKFLSTLSLRRATCQIILDHTIMFYFYPRSPCGERRRGAGYPPQLSDFYPRSPCGERRTPKQSCAKNTVFLSTLSLRRATAVTSPRSSHRAYFYPRSPCGERLVSSPAILIPSLFLSTLSLRRATDRLVW